MVRTKAFKVVLKEKKGFQRLLKGLPRTSGMKSGQMILASGEDVGEHDTGGREEILIVLEGEATVLSGSRGRIIAASYSIVYIPAHTAHNVLNLSKSRLRYIYVVSPV
ncbi:MAG: cupin domain-containing protein [Candidatus Omnitrophota bacterium]